MMICQICGKKPKSAFNKPHSLYRTKRTVKPNIQKKENQYICTRCLKNRFVSSAEQTKGKKNTSKQN